MLVSGIQSKEMTLSSPRSYSCYTIMKTITRSRTKTATRFRRRSFFGGLINSQTFFNHR